MQLMHLSSAHMRVLRSMASVGQALAQMAQPRQVSQSRSFFTGTAGLGGGLGLPGTAASAQFSSASFSFTPWTN